MNFKCSGLVNAVCIVGGVVATGVALNTVELEKHQILTPIIGGAIGSFLGWSVTKTEAKRNIAAAVCCAIGAYFCRGVDSAAILGITGLIISKRNIKTTALAMAGAVSAGILHGATHLPSSDIYVLGGMAIGYFVGRLVTKAILRNQPLTSVRIETV